MSSFIVSAAIAEACFCRQAEGQFDLCLPRKPDIAAAGYKRAEEAYGSRRREKEGES